MEEPAKEAKPSQVKPEPAMSQSQPARQDYQSRKEKDQLRKAIRYQEFLPWSWWMSLSRLITLNGRAAIMSCEFDKLKPWYLLTGRQ